MALPHTSPAVVVGVDGSRAAVRAALWALDEAGWRGLPLRLVAAAEPGTDPAAAEDALREAAAALHAVDPAVEIATRIVAAGPIVALLEASRNAAMICVGLIGLKHFDHARVGSTAGALIASAHCPITVVRSGDRPDPAAPGWVVAELDQTPESAGVLQYAVEEARMRRTPLRVLGIWQSGQTTASESDRAVRAQLDRRLETWRHRYPDLDVAPIAVRDSGLDWLAANAGAIQLVVIGARNGTGAAELLGPRGLAALRDSDCSVLIVDSQRLL
ncbi:MAG: universal stress protein [Mycobacterium sp.]